MRFFVLYYKGSHNLSKCIASGYTFAREGWEGNDMSLSLKGKDSDLLLVRSGSRRSLGSWRNRSRTQPIPRAERSVQANHTTTHRRCHLFGGGYDV